MPLQRISDDGFLTETDLHAFVHQALDDEPIDGKSILFIIPDSTRSMPMPAMFRALFEVVHPRAAQMDYIIALGTHPPMPDDAIHKLLGITHQERTTTYADVGIFNHEWQNPDALTCIGTITEDQTAKISGGLLRRSADVLINKRIRDYDLVCIVGPVFPHEVVGFSGGNKYFFPGIAGAEILNLFHWLGALITNPVINGVKHTPVRDVINLAASFLTMEKRCFCLNVTGTDCKGIFFGAPEEAWEAAADMAAATHITYKDKPFKSVLAMVPEMYDDVWVAGKGMYKLEPVVADGGELPIYAPHVREISFTHGDLLKEIGYHTRDYFLAQMDRFAHIPGGILAHSTHVRGLGTYTNGTEHCRIDVTLATAIPQQDCHAINLGYRDPNTIDPTQWQNREQEGYLHVPHAGEVLYRLIEGNPVPSSPCYD